MIKTHLTLVVGLLAVQVIAPASADDKLGPSDPIAAIDGNPIYLGELNLILTERLKVRDLDRVEIEVQQATAALLVRRHLAMKSLREQGGAALNAMVQRQVSSFAAEAQRRGSSLAEQARARKADEKSLATDLAWRAAWAQYLKSRLNDKNLRLFFQQQRERYAGHRWEVSQIFLEMDMKDGPSVEAAEGSMLELANEIRENSAVADAFADAARQHSDSGSAEQGGMVGWVEKDGDLPRSVMSLIRETKPGQLGGPVRSPLGLHLVLVHREEVGDLTYEQLTDQAQLRRDATNAMFDALVKQQRNAKITWFVRSLQPPPSVLIFPN